MDAGFNVRVYGILLSVERDQVLLVREKILGKNLLKFPGGGVEHLEGPEAALKREFLEELGLPIELNGPVFYVSPRFHRSLFRPQQLLGLYWQVQAKASIEGLKALVPHMSVYWQPLKSWDPTELTHTLDQEVANRILTDCGRP